LDQQHLAKCDGVSATSMDAGTIKAVPAILLAEMLASVRMLTHGGSVATLSKDVRDLDIEMTGTVCRLRSGSAVRICSLLG